MKSNLKKILALPFFISALAAAGQLPDTDIFVAGLEWNSGTPVVREPKNMTKRQGYDNQPFFLPDGNGFYFVAITKDTTQSDIYVSDFKKHTIRPFTKTVVSEYSPQLSPDGSKLGVVRVDADSAQRFYTIPVDEPRMAFHHEGSDSIGYFTFLTDTTIALFILGSPPSLQLLDLNNGTRTWLRSDIGRCLKTDAKRSHLYFLEKTAPASIVRMDTRKKTFEKVVTAMDGVEDFELLKDGSILCGKAGKLYRFAQDQQGWELLCDLSSNMGDFYRISVDPTGSHIAFVTYTGKRP